MTDKTCVELFISGITNNDASTIHSSSYTLRSNGYDQLILCLKVGQLYFVQYEPPFNAHGPGISAMRMRKKIISMIEKSGGQIYDCFNPHLVFDISDHSHALSNLVAHNLSNPTEEGDRQIVSMKRTLEVLKTLNHNPCFRCGNTNTSDSGIYCSPCLVDLSLFICIKCGNTHPNEKRVSQDLTSDCVCADCFRRIYTHCSGCLTYSCGSQRCSDCGVSLCPHCVEHSHYCRGTYIDETERRGIFVGSNAGDIITDPRLVGTEIELEGMSDRRGELVFENQSIQLEHDGSLDDGIEIVTPPASQNELEKIINNVSEVVKLNGLATSRQCGLHIHLDARDIRDDDKALGRVLMVYYFLENTIFLFVPKERRQNTYCQHLRGLLNLSDEVFATERADRIFYHTTDQEHLYKLKRSHRGINHYMALNLHSVYYRGTLEIRHHSGTRETKKILFWIYLHQRIVDYAIHEYQPHSLDMLIREQGEENRIGMLFDVLKLTQEAKQYFSSRYETFREANQLGGAGYYATNADYEAESIRVTLNQQISRINSAMNITGTTTT